MATAPKVQTLAEAMAELNPAYAQSQQVVEKRQAGLGAKYDAQRAGITAERGEGFNAINNQATARGLSFSGIPVEEQARYLSTKYLPGLQQANYQQNEEDLTLQGQLAGISKEKRLGAMSRIDQQQSALNAWNMQQQTLEAQRREAEANRAFQAQQGQIDRQFRAGQSAADRSFSASQNAAAAASVAAASSAASGILNGARGKDGKVHPNTFQKALEAYVDKGGSPAAFREQFAGYVNTKYASEYGYF